MKLSKIRAAHSTRQLAGTTIPRQNTTSVAMRAAKAAAEGAPYAGESGTVEGDPAKIRLDRARRFGGRVSRADGGQVSRISEDSKQEAKRLRDDASADITKGILGANAGSIGGSAAMMRRRGPGILGMALPLGGLGYMGKKVKEAWDKGDEASRIEKGLAEPGKEDRATGGSVKGKWIAGATKNKGALHRALKVPMGEKIPAKKLDAAADSDNPTMRKRANLAKTLKGMHK